mgnify:CR=1 FL=1
MLPCSSIDDGKFPDEVWSERRKSTESLISSEKPFLGFSIFGIDSRAWRIPARPWAAPKYSDPWYAYMSGTNLVRPRCFE